MAGLPALCDALLVLVLPDAVVEDCCDALPELEELALCELLWLGVEGCDVLDDCGMLDDCGILEGCGILDG